MAFLSRLFKRDDPLAEREEARRQGMRDARRHPLGEFTDPEFQPAYVTEIRAWAREEITQVDRRLAARRTALLERALGQREAILRELGRADTRPEPYVNGHAGPAMEEDPFISIAESRARRAEARRRAVVEESNSGVQRARARIEHLTQEWESALIERDHEVEAVHARAERLIAAYKSGVLLNHPRKEDIPSLWKGEVIAMDATGTPAASSGREEIGRILREVEARIEVWHAEVVSPKELPADLPSPTTAQLPPPAHHPDPDPDQHPNFNPNPGSDLAPNSDSHPGLAPNSDPVPDSGSDPAFDPDPHTSYDRNPSPHPRPGSGP
ncbi:hypothetical protein ACFPZ3_07470, partial [Nonomuraea insulae]